jgi:hypothetical protein
MSDQLLIFTYSGHFYSVDAVEGVSLRQQAKDHGKLNDFIEKITDDEGDILWERPKEYAH